MFLPLEKQPMEGIINFETALDVPQLDERVGYLSPGTPAEVRLIFFLHRRYIYMTSYICASSKPS